MNLKNMVKLRNSFDLILRNSVLPMGAIEQIIKRVYEI